MKEDYALPVAAVLTLVVFVGERMAHGRERLTGAPTA
jgi:hypothetical protein